MRMGHRIVLVVTAVAVLVPGSSNAATSGWTRPLAHRTVQLPPGAAVFDYQIGGSYPPAQNVAIVDRDRASGPARGRYNICYINAFQTQPTGKRWWLRHHRWLMLRSRSGRLVEDPGWPGEYLLDTSTRAKRRAIAAIMGGWIDGCARRGFDAVEPDALDSWTRPGVRGLLTRADNLALATLLVRRAHADGLAIAQKNTVEVSRVGRSRIHFDFAIAEECQRYNECDGYRAVYGKRVYEVEYRRRDFTRACADHRGTMSILLRDHDVTPRGDDAYRYAHC